MADSPKRSQIEVTLAYMAIGVIAVSILSMAATLILLPWELHSFQR